nr:PREDICTED: cell cycle checkpoint control protein RAD9B isoform X2 [Lepisosteus oculatus]
MKCVIAGGNVKVFGKTIHALARIGEELWLDPLEKGLAVRSVNSSHSAYGCFLFSPLFFQHYSRGAQTPSAAKDEKPFLKCKLSTKTVLPIFRCLATIERNVERCNISINCPGTRVMFQFFCKHGITKTYNLGYQECESLQAVFPTHLCPNVLKAQSRLLGGIVTHFPVSQEEITLTVTAEKVNVKNYYEEEMDRLKVMHTEVSLHPDEFDYFQGLLAFAESHALSVSIHFGTSGKPVAFRIEDMVLEATVVLATLTDARSRTGSQSTGVHSQAEGLYSCCDPPAAEGQGGWVGTTAGQGLVAVDTSAPAPAPPGNEPELVPSSQGSPVPTGRVWPRDLAGRGEGAPEIQEDSAAAKGYGGARVYSCQRQVQGRIPPGRNASPSQGRQAQTQTHTFRPGPSQLTYRCVSGLGGGNRRAWRKPS